MEEGLDTGPLFHSLSMTLDPRETGGSLHDKLMLMSGEVAVRTLAEMEQMQPIPQTDEGVCWAPKISKSDGRIDWAESALALDRRIRAMSPWPGGWAEYSEGRLKVIEAEPVEASGRPGMVLATTPNLVIACGEGALALKRVQAPGRKPVSGRDFANGARLVVQQEL